MNPIAWLSDIMFQVLQFFYTLCGNYGLAIILITVAVKIALYPLTLQSTQQMSAMQKLQPKLDDLKKKHKGAPDKFQKEVMGLYRQHGVNPLGGCLPTLLQIPFFLALFFALNSPEFSEIVSIPSWQTRFFWITNLAKPDPYYILVILIGVSTYFSQKMLTGTNPQGKQMLLFMPAFIAFVSLPFPAGVQLYWFIQNLLTMLQQWYILKHKV